MVETEINNINDVQGASVTEAKTSNAPAVTDADRKAALAELTAPAGTSINITETDKGLSADDLSRLNQDLNTFKRELKEESKANELEKEQLKENIREQVIREMREAEEKKKLQDSMSNSTEQIGTLQAQLKALQDKINNPTIGQEVNNKSPFESENDVETMSKDKERDMDEASRIAFMNERFGKL